MFPPALVPAVCRVNPSRPLRHRYPDYRLGPTAAEPYAPDVLYWHVLAARLIFVLVFEVSCGGRLRLCVETGRLESVMTAG